MTSFCYYLFFYLSRQLWLWVSDSDGALQSASALTIIFSFSYRKMAKGISNSVKLLPRPPVKEAADWIEYTLALGGLPFLRPRGLDLPFYQLYLLDILLLAFLILFLTVLAVRFLLKAVINHLLAPVAKEKAS